MMNRGYMRKIKKQRPDFEVCKSTASDLLKSIGASGHIVQAVSITRYGNGRIELTCTLYPNTAPLSRRLFYPKIRSVPNVSYSVQ